MGHARRDVREYGDYALTAERENGNNLVIVAGVNRQLVADRRAQPQNRREITARLLDRNNARMFCELHIGLRLDVHPRARRHIVENCGNADAVCNRRVMRSKSVLRTLIVVRRYEEERVCPHMLRIFR